MYTTSTATKVTRKLNSGHNEGFALLITLIVVSVVLSIGLSILHITSKQLSLSVSGRESEVAFQGAAMGMECMRYHRSVPATRESLLHEGAGAWPPSLDCADISPASYSEDTLLNDSGGGRFLYSYNYQYDIPRESGSDICIETTLYITDMRDSSANLNYALSNEGLSNLTCTAGTVCTTIFARGYNRPCDSLDSILTVQRELSIQY